MDDLKQRLQAEIYAIMGPEGADYSCEPVVFYMQAAAALDAKDAELARLREDVGKWQRAFAAQSSKLQSVLHIPEARAALTARRGE